jgi:opacity protein-like surface antigen
MKMKSYLLATAAVFISTHAMSADTITHIPVAEPAPVPEYEFRGSEDVAVNSWEGFYIRGDVGYVMTDMKGINYVLPLGATGTFDTYNLDDSWTIGGGVGYQINHYLRTDLTLDYMFDADFNGSTSGSCGVATSCVSTDITSMSAYTLLANAYVDFWAHGNFSAYVGGGIGGTYVKWDDLNNTSCDTTNSANCDPTYTHSGHSEWRFTGALMAGGAYHFRCDLAADAGYRYRWVSGGRMFGYQAGGGPGFDEDFNVHEVRAGLRYYPGRDCSPPPVIPPYVPPVYK